MRRIRVVHVHKVAGISGSEKHLLQLVASLDKGTFEPIVLILRVDEGGSEGYLQRLRDIGADARVFDIRADIDPVLFFRLLVWFRRERPDIVHTHLIHADLHGIPAARLAGVPVIISTKHNDDRFRRHWPIVALERWLSKRVNRTIAISEALRQFLLRTTDQPSQTITTVRYGYDSSLDDPAMQNEPTETPVERSTVLAVGRLVEQKGHDVLLQAFKHVVRRVENARLVIVGEGDRRDYLEKLVHEFELRECVTLKGHSSNVRALMSNAAVLAHPSRWEGFGLVLLEAMNEGLPIVATCVSAIPEVVEHERTGLLVPAEDPAALANAIVRLLEDRALAQRLGYAGKDRLDREFTVTRMARATERIYCDALYERTGKQVRRVGATVC